LKFHFTLSDTVVANLTGNVAFEAVIDGYSVRMDADPMFGGSGYGPKPKPLVLSALAGCTGIDVVSILRKKQVPFTAFRVLVSGDTTETHPKYYNKIHLIFEVTGENFSGDQSVYDKVARAIHLSAETYCGVSAMLRHSAEITNEIRLVNG
jgi:putative redox protein